MVVGSVIVVEQAPVPVHAVPPGPTVQPMNNEFAPVEAVSESWLPCGIIPVQLPGQLMPADGATAMPVPEPPKLIVTGYLAISKVAVTVVAASTLTVQVGALPVQPPPLQPASSAPVSGIA